MIGYLEQLKCDLEARLVASVNRVAVAGFCSARVGSSAADLVQVRLVPVEKRDIHGVFTTNVPLLLKQALSHCQPDCEGRSAIAIAQVITDALALDDLMVFRVAFAAPGFLNFYLADGWQKEALKYILRQLTPMNAEPAHAVTADIGDAAGTADAFGQLDFETQYAYNRMCNQLELLTGLGYSVPDVNAACLDLLTAPQELRLMEHLAAAPLTGNPGPARQRARQYLSQLAALFHLFFNISQIRGESREIAAARMALLQGCQLVFESVLKESFF